MRACDKCQLGTPESVWHLVMQCPFYEDLSSELFASIERLGTEVAIRMINDPPQYFNVIMGKQPEYASFEEMIEIWFISGAAVCSMFKRAIADR